MKGDKRVRKIYGTCSKCGNRPAKIKKLMLCGTCYDIYLKEVNPEYKLKQSENCSKWKIKNKKEYLETQKKYSKNLSFEERWRRNIWKNFKLTPDDYFLMLKNQNECCAVCGKHVSELKKDKHFHIDHDHKTGLIRGLLCFRCNFGLGWFQDDVVKIKNAFEHLCGINSLKFSTCKKQKGNCSKINVGTKKEIVNEQ